MSDAGEQQGGHSNIEAARAEFCDLLKESFELALKDRYGAFEKRLGGVEEAVKSGGAVAGNIERKVKDVHEWVNRDEDRILGEEARSLYAEVQESFTAGLTQQTGVFDALLRALDHDAERRLNELSAETKRIGEVAARSEDQGKMLQEWLSKGEVNRVADQIRTSSEEINTSLARVTAQCVDGIGQRLKEKAEEEAARRVRERRERVIFFRVVIALQILGLGLLIYDLFR